MIKEELHSLESRINLEEASRRIYDAVIVGSGVSGSIMAKELARAGYQVLVLEAGPGRDFSQHGYQHYLENFYATPNKDNNSPFPWNPNAEMPRVPPKADSYMVQNGPV